VTPRHRCLKRTEIAADFGKREIDPSELGAFDGPALQERVWNQLKREGLVANGRGDTVRLTPKGKRELARLEKTRAR
jgi:ribosomal protein S19E (S16A)